MNIGEADRELFLMINNVIKEGRGFTPDEKQYFDKLFDKIVKKMDES